MAAYLIGGNRVSPDDARFSECMAAARASHHRPLCLCTRHAPEMYVAKLGAKFIAKRMPGTGSRHAPACLSYETSRKQTGGVRDGAISMMAGTGETSLKLDFALFRTDALPPNRRDNRGTSSHVPSGRGLTPSGLLHYLWDEAGLSRSGFAAGQSWSTVRRHLLAAAEGKLVADRRLQDALYIPEAFYVEHRNAIAARRTGRWSHCESEARAAGLRRPLVLLLGEVKRIVSAPFGPLAIIKHVPDRPFLICKDAHPQLVQRFERELAPWVASNRLRMVIIATFAVDGGRDPVIQNFALMPTTAHWIPVHDAFDSSAADLPQHRTPRLEVKVISAALRPS